MSTIHEDINTRFDKAMASATTRNVPMPVIRCINEVVRNYCLFLADMHENNINPDHVITATVHSCMTMLIELANAISPPEGRKEFVSNQLLRALGAVPQYMQTQPLPPERPNGEDPNPPEAA